MALKDEGLTRLPPADRSFGLIAALAWNGAIQTLFKQIFGTADSLAAQMSYAIIVTIIAVVVIIWIARAVAHAKAEEKK